MLAVVIDDARQAQAEGKVPSFELKQAFIAALEHLIRDAMGAAMATVEDQFKSGWTDAVPPEDYSGKAAGEPAFQALVLRHRSPQVKEYVALSSSIRQDRQQLVRAINAVAHPGKLQHMPTGWQRDAMGALHRALPIASSDSKTGPAASEDDAPTAESHADSKSVKSSSWSVFADTLRAVLTMPQINTESDLKHQLQELLQSQALLRLQRFDALTMEDDVRQYQALVDRQGPRSGSNTAAAQGAASRQHGQAVEGEAAQVFRARVNRMNRQYAASSEAMQYQLVTSMHVPASLADGASHAKTEWDVVVLEKAGNAPDIWDLRLLMEVKASADAAVTDFPRLLRGLELLAQADADTVYTFETAQGSIKIRGGSLVGLSTDDATLKKTVRYWCAAPPVLTAQALNPANRMRLLSTPACVDYASRLLLDQKTDSVLLEPVWDELLESPRLRPVLLHGAIVRSVKGLMIGLDDRSAVMHQGIDGILQTVKD